MKTKKNFHNLYLECDVLLLADVFKKLRNDSLNNYGLCPRCYLKATTLRWDGFLNMPKINLELISDLDIHIFFVKSMRAGVSNRKSKVKSKYLKSYDPKKELKILYT